jgi:hypothetical protein
VRRFIRRVVVCLCFAAGAAGGTFAVLSALGPPVGAVSAAQATLTTRTIAFGGATVALRTLPTGTTCYTVRDGAGSARGCLRLNATRIGYAVAPRAVGGVAGANVRAVIVRLTRKGTVWATVKDGAFLAAVPPAYRPRTVVKVLKDGTRRSFPVG